MDVLDTLLKQGYSYEQLFKMGFLSVATPDVPVIADPASVESTTVTDTEDEPVPANITSPVQAEPQIAPANTDVLDAIAALGAEVKSLMQAINRSAAVRPSDEPHQMSLDEAIRGIYTDKK